MFKKKIIPIQEVEKLKTGGSWTRFWLLFQRKDENLKEKIKESLLKFEVGPSFSESLSELIMNNLLLAKPCGPLQIKEVIKKTLLGIYVDSEPLCFKKNELNIVLFSGVNGVGKSSTVAKLAKFLNMQTLLVAGDTFKFGAVQQLREHAEKLGYPVILPTREKEDPSALIYRAIHFSNSNNINLILCDTSGRLHNKDNLLKELTKMNKTIHKLSPHSLKESLLVLDSTLGQTNLSQSSIFLECSQISGIVLTKMDRLTRGGFVFAINHKLKIPIKFITTGEKYEDIQPFDISQFIDGFLENLIL